MSFFEATTKKIKANCQLTSLLGQNIDVSSMKCILNEINLKSKNYTLLVYSHINCGPCHVAKRDLKEIAEQIDVVFVEYGDFSDFIKLKNKYNGIYFLVQPDSCYSLNKMPDFFPKIYLIDNEMNIVWRKKGWKSTYLTILERKIKIE